MEIKIRIITFTLKFHLKHTNMKLNFDIYWIEIIETAALLILWIVLRIVIKKLITKRLVLNEFSPARKKVTIKIFNTILNLVAAITLVLIWSIDKADIFLFISSILTILGVAFFAQWSHISNITSGLIIFFNQNTRIGDTIKLMDKDFDIEGKITDIGPFFLKIKTAEKEVISLPNNILLTKAIKIISN